MRTIERTSRFKRDYKRESRGQHRAYLDTIVEALANDRPLEPHHHDHALSGEWGDHRDCHAKPDLLLIYQKSGANILRLVRLGSHAELGL